ncbi:unnamed protein product [Kuraishia capsulata CBS 1993]|uniref:SH3 domain-containing protein n=1 Tax=Kuraishia capsulata CBS 1993 TaxID=1382522 RepID=W6MHY8_9ASCO|nr:uncharacterized protein KUCA_T00001641001 [Kuraishia capsulata CBS 1993]CDK25671.1 unnamed protein product [Kuraishia capsulata CBS 1993]
MDPKVLNLLKNESTVNKKTDVYTELLSSLVVEVKEVTSVSAARIIAPLKALLKEFEAVSKFIKRQNDALIECRLYDESYQKLLARNEDTIKSKQKEMDLRVRMEDCRKTLDNYNYSLRNELPLFMRIVQRFMTHIFTMIYYANAYLFYQLKETMQTINNVFKFSANSLEFAEIVRTFHNSHDNIAASTKDISICHFHQLLLDKITMDVERIYADSERLTPKETCIAMYDFEGVQINDLKFNAGDEIEITEKTGKGWWNGRNLTTGQAGSFPVNYTDANK